MSTPADACARLVEALRRLLARYAGGPVELVETHISCILLTPAEAYKLKKPLRLPFADFSTPAARRHFCEEELRLNRRFAPALYLDVLPVCGSVEAPRLGGDGEAIDWVLRMRRFPAGSEFDALARSGALAALDVDRFAHRLARFQAEAPLAAPDSAWGTPVQVAQTIAGVFDALAPLLDDAQGVRLRRLRAWVDARQPALAALWSARRTAGWVREGHGDLHLANVVRWGGEVTAFDCIEFSPDLRWIDTLADAAFFAMDLRAHGRAGLAWRFLDTYLADTGDYGGLAVLRPYEIYRALVREMAGRMRDAQGAPPAARPDYLACAEALAAPTQPRLLITHGLSGSGKSTVAAALLQAAGAVRLRSDVERKRLFGLPALADSGAQGIDIYTPEATRRTFERLREGARTALEAGYMVIVDAAFLRRRERDAFHALARERGVPFSILHCHAGVPQLRERVQHRRAAGGDPSEADLRVLARQQETAEPLAPDECAVALDVATDAAWSAEALCERWMAA